MATTIITKNGSGAPTADDLSVGELAVDLTNKRLYSKNSSSEVIELGVNTASSLDVTGTVTADGLTVDTDTLYVDATNNRVGIGTSSPTGPLHVAGSDSTVPIKIDNTGTGGNTWRIWSTNDAASDGGGKLGFYNEDTATRAMTLDSSGQVGIGTSSPDYNFHVSGSGDTIAAVTAGASSVAGLNLGNSTNKADGGIRYDNSADALIFRASNAEKMRIDSSGNLLVGTTGAINNTHTIQKSGASTNSLVVNNSSSSSPFGIQSRYSAADPNNTSSNFFEAYGYNGTSFNKRFEVRSNGGIANFQANDANLSDERLKTDIVPLGSMWDKFKAIEIVTFKYKDQTHDDDNIGVIAQQIESVAPELVSNDGFGETPEGEEPLKAIYTADMYHAAIRALQEAMDRIETLEAKVAQLEGAN